MMNTSDKGIARIRQGRVLNDLDRLQTIHLNHHSSIFPVLDESQTIKNIL